MIITVFHAGEPNQISDANLAMLQKGTKNALETGRTFATIFADMEFRQRLLEVHSEEEFKIILLKHAQDLAEEQSNPDKRLMENNVDIEYDQYVSSASIVLSNRFESSSEVLRSSQRLDFIAVASM